MDISELKGTVLQRFQELTDSEIGIMQSMEEHPIGEVVMKLLGPELVEIFSEPEGETEQMLADDMPSRGQAFGGRMDNLSDEDIPNMPSAGPNPEQYRVDPNRPEFKRPRPEETDLMMKREMASR